jgi:hypothetical protein
MITRIFQWLDGINGQWLAAWTLVAFVATLILMYIVSFLGGPLQEKTGVRVAKLQVIGASVVFKEKTEVEADAKRILEAWGKTGVFQYALISQQFDFLFPLAYGSFSLLLSIGMWRCHKKYPIGGRWVWCLGFGAMAAVLDELENIFIWLILTDSIEPGWMWLVLVSGFAIPKLVLLFPVVPIIFLSALRRARA